MYPGYQRFFSRAAGIFRVWPKADTSSAVGRSRAGHYKDLTETGNRARNVSGTQGTADAAWNYDLVIHSHPHPGQTKKPINASRMCAFSKRTGIWNSTKFNQGELATLLSGIQK